MTKKPTSIIVLSIINLLLITAVLVLAITSLFRSIKLSNPRHIVLSFVRLGIAGLFIWGFILSIQLKKLGRILTLIFAWIISIFSGIEIFRRLISIKNYSTIPSITLSPTLLIILILLFSMFLVYGILNIKFFKKHKEIFN